MARPLRLEFPGVIYHLTSRGNARQRVFFTDADRELFLHSGLGRPSLLLDLPRLLLDGQSLSLAGGDAQGQSLHRHAPAQRQLHSKFQPPLLEANRALIKETLRDKSIIREPLVQISLSGSIRRSSRSGPFLRIGEVVHILAANKHGQRENFQRLAIVVKPLYPKRRRAALDPNPS